ncbi:MAG: energy-coupling factor transporter ATPase [Oscillospiraceae bacterium]|jgi:energy-coupling factor transport system ATP-binding protein|nr:energy-coupling factor transporter ATPase [Oscillospiraceae bacterium]
MDEIIRFEHVSYSYPTEVAAADKDGAASGSSEDRSVTPAPALNGVSLAVRRGETVALLGHNGSGKSTLVKMLNGMLTPDTGTVTVCGMDTGGDPLKIRQQVGLVFQNPDNQIVATVVDEDVAFALENLGVPPAEIRERVDAALRDVGMSEYKSHAPHRLSGGQKQRVAIAGVLAMNPTVLALDEPTAMLDPKGRVEVMETVRRLNAEKGVTVVMVTHHMNEAALFDRVVVMDKGAVALDGSPREVFRRAEELQALGLTVPQTVALAQALGLDAAPLTEEECADAIYHAYKGEPHC